MSPLPTEAPPAAAAALGLASRLLGQGVAHTVFLGADAAWSYAAGGGTPQRHEPAAWMEAHAGGNVRLVLSGALTHQLLVADPTLPLEDEAGLVAWARHQFVHYHGVAAQRWPMAPWMVGVQRGVSAAHGLDLERLLQSAAAQRVRLRAVQPWWAVALHAAAEPAPTLAMAAQAELWLVEGVQLTRVVCAAGAVALVEQHWLAQADAAGLAARLGERPLDAPQPWVLGYGLDDTGIEALPLRCLGPLGGAAPAARWVGA